MERHSRFRVSLLLLTFAFGIVPVNAQIRNDRLYNDIVQKRSGELVAVLDAGINPDAQLFIPESDRQISLLELALRAANDDAAVELLRRGASMDMGDEFFGMSLLAVSAQQGLTQTVSFLIERDSTEFNQDGAELLRLAVGYNRAETAALLLQEMREREPTWDRQQSLDESLRVAAYSKSDTDVLEALVLAGANPEGSPGLLAALYVAVQRCSPNGVEFFLGEGVNPNPIYREKHVAISAFECFALEDSDSETNAREILRLLSENGTDVCSFAEYEAARSPQAQSALRDLGLCVR